MVAACVFVAVVATVCIIRVHTKRAEAEAKAGEMQRKLGAGAVLPMYD
jgi:hypothetical protein